MKLFTPVLLALNSEGFEVSRLQDEPIPRDLNCSSYPTDTIAFLKLWNDEAQPYSNTLNIAAWEQATNITEENLEAENEAEKEMAAWTEVINGCAKEMFGDLVAKCKADINAADCTLVDEVCAECTGEEFGQQAWTKAKQLRALNMLQDLGSAVLGAESDDFKALQDALGSMGTVYSSSKVPDQNSDPSKPTLHPLDPDLTAIFMTESTPENQAEAECAYEKLKYYWDAWNTEVGTNCIDDYEIFVEKSNKAAVMNGFDDTGDSWRSNYEDPNFRKSLEEIWNGKGGQPGVKSLYEKIHGYMRWKLSQTYGEERVSSGDDPIPEHLFGNMWAQTWGALYDIAAPFPEAGDRPDATPNIEPLTTTQMFEYADEFFSSMGMTPMTDKFWERSVIDKRTDVEDMVCHASAWDFMDDDGNHGNGTIGDYRIKMCTVHNQDDFITIHHEMGHIQYYQQYAHQPVIYRSGANPGFHEAIGDTMALSVSTPKHLETVGLLETVESTEEADLNYLMSILLDKVTFLPFGYLMDLYRWDIFDTTKGITKDKYQEHWDKLRLEYQGLIPPLDRSKPDNLFDAAGKYHIPANTPYIRYFVSFIVQFQFYERMCILAGQYDPADPDSEPLYKCDFYQNAEAGQALKNVLQQGQSQPWQDTLDEFLCGNSTDPDCDGGMSAGALIRYFKPIEEWLDENQKNNSWVVGWDVNSSWKPCGYEDGSPCTLTAECPTDLDFVEPEPTEPPTETTKPVTESTEEPVTEPVTKPVTEPVTEPATEPATTTEGAASAVTISVLTVLCTLFL